MRHVDVVWHEALRAALEGEDRPDRTGVGHRGVFGHMLTVPNHVVFPAITTKKLAFETVKREMACFVNGTVTLGDMHSMGLHIWDKNANENDGEVGPIYGKQWTDWFGINQMKDLYERLRKDPSSRRHLVSCWNVSQLEDMCLPPCPFAFQVSVREGHYLDMIVYQRSCDAFLGLPFDIAGYALLQRLIAKSTGYMTTSLTFMIADLHVYNNHIEQAQEVLERFPKQMPRLSLDDEASMFRFKPEWAKLVDYESHAPIAAEMN